MTSTLRERAERIITGRLDHDELTIDLLCRALSVSRSTLYGLYRDENGVNARLRREKLERARNALSASDTKIGDVATRFGFHDHAHFTRIFRETYGVTPSAWRKSKP